MPQRPPPTPPYPELERRPSGSFGWLDAELVQDGWLAELGAHATAVLTLLSLAADRRGASFYSRDRMATALGLSLHEVDEALSGLLDARLVAHRPWRPGRLDGVWQLLPVPSRRTPSRSGRQLSVGDVLRSLGYHGPAGETAE